MTTALRNMKKAIISFHYGMIPIYDPEIHGHHDYFIVDECDSIILDRAEEFLPRYTAM